MSFQCGVRQNNIELSHGLKQLKDEHGPLLNEIHSLISLCNEMENSKRIYEIFSTLYEKVIEFFSELEAHSEKEEGILFPMIEAYIGKEHGPLAVMEYEHEQAKHYINHFLTQVQCDRDLTDVKRVKYAFLVRNACFVLQDHFAKEENVLFPMAESLLSKEEKEELAERFLTV